MSDDAASRPPWRVYVGDELLDDASDTSTSTASTHEARRRLLDAAFARRARFTLAHLPARIRQQPSAAPSPVLRWLLLHHHHHDTEPAPAAAAAVASQGPAHTPVSSLASTTTAATTAAVGAVSALARRGVGPKDPLLQRLLKKQQQQQQQQQQTTAAAAVAGAVPTTSEASATPPPSLATPARPPAAAPLNAGPVSSSSNSSHWSQHPFSAMTAMSWRVFRQQLGITIELVAPSVSTTTASTTPADTTGTAAAAAANSAATATATTATPLRSAMPAADALPAIRCWEEAQLPLSLGRCVTHAYALPTAVQAQCVPLALLPRPAPSRPSAAAASPDGTTTATPASPRATATSTSAPAAASSSSVLGMDVLAVAETGSGKTAAYLVPLLYHVLCRAPKLLGHPDRISLGPLSAVIVPTRELAEQVTASLLQLCGQGSGDNSASQRLTPALIRTWEAQEMSDTHGSGGGVSAGSPPPAAPRNLLSEFRVVKIVGGESREAQYAALANGAHCVVGTVGQLQTLLEDRLLSLGNTQFVVMDEADRMIDEQQEERLVAVLERCPHPRQTVMFTATLSSACAAVARRYLARSGYYLVRTPYRCASIRQSFELVPDSAVTTDVSEDAVADAMRGPTRPPQRRRTEPSSALPSAPSPSEQQQRQRRRLHPLIHAQKFARLVTWLVYATGPIIVFANTKATCDALWEELRAEAEHLDAQQEYYTIDDLVGPPPDGLTFREGVALQSASTAAPAAAVSSAAAASTRRTPTLSNLTSVAVVHAELSQAERRNLVGQFQRRQRQVLITTDLLARGLDVAGVTLVFNYDVPWTSASGLPADAVTLYIHRIGRTGRAGSTGVAATLVTLPAAMVQRAEEVAREEGTSRAGGGGGGGEAAGAPQSFAWSSSAPSPSEWGRVTAARGADADDDGHDALAELFDGDPRSVWMAGVAAAVSASASGDGGTGGPRRSRRRDGGGGDDDADDDGVDADAGEDHDDAHVNGNGTRAPRKKRTRQGGDGGEEEDEEGGGGRKAAVAFASDVAVLRPLWSFLVACAEGEGCRDGAAALRRGTYAKISMPPALACVMAQLAATSQYGRITL